MDPIIDLGLETTIWLQRTFPQLEGFFGLVSALGVPELYLIVAGLIYWSIDKRNGKFLLYLLAVSNSLNVMLKHAFRGVRPYWLDLALGRSVETSYGVPSNHAQTATVFYLYLAYWLRKSWVWLLALTLIVLMGLSRIYLGVHFVHDVLAGYLLGLSVFLGFLVWRRRFQSSFQNRILGQRLLIVVITPAFLLGAYLVSRLLLGTPVLEVTWVDYVGPAEAVSLEHVATTLGLLAGLGVGFMLEASRIHFLVDGSGGKRVLRALLGLVVTIILWRGLGAILPDEPLWLGLPLRFARYIFVGLWVAYLAPMTFVRLRLASASQDPEAGLRISDGNILRG